MKNTTTLMLAAFAAVALGAGVANAQSLTPSAAQGAYYASQNRTASQVMAPRANNGQPLGQTGAVQYGSSDLEFSHPTAHFDTNLTEGGGG